ncbi:MAG: 30S ribosomal protein S14 [Alphaproteobacteria bacterium]|jgi:small subunit ribosomal protein S14|nr:30S ribosomal protein S14 [Alphaproteobacteria bacterium]
MAKKSAIERNEKRRRMAKKYNGKRERLKAIANNRDLPMEEQFQARLKLSKIPRNASKGRVQSRCEITGRPRGVYKKFKMSRIALRDLASAGHIPGMVKSSW